MQIYELFDVDNVPAAHNFIKNENPPQVFSYEFFKIFNNTYFVEICKGLLLVI